MLKLPQFAFKIMIEDAPITVRFKSIGDPKHVKILFTPPSKQTFQSIAPLPKEEILSWSSFAKQIYKTLEEEDLLLESKPTAAHMQVQNSNAANSANKEPGSGTPILRKVRSSGAKVNSLQKAVAAATTNGTAAGSDTGIVLARQARIDVAYRTAASGDPKKQYLARYEGPAKNPSLYVIHVYFPELREWSRVEVAGDYKLRIQSEDSPPKEKTKMPAKTKAASGPTPVPSSRLVQSQALPAKNSPVAKTPKGLSVYEAWGQAFAEHGLKKDAPEQITKFMEKSFPGRKTLWAKWVNPVRARYNAGKLPGIVAPPAKIPVYKFDEKPARSGKERRAAVKPKAKKK